MDTEEKKVQCEPFFSSLAPKIWAIAKKSTLLQVGGGPAPSSSAPRAAEPEPLVHQEPLFAWYCVKTQSLTGQTNW